MKGEHCGKINPPELVELKQADVDYEVDAGHIRVIPQVPYVNPLFSYCLSRIDKRRVKDIFMWTVHIPKKVQKAVQGLPPLAQRSLWHLVKDLRLNGPVAGNWPNYGKLSGDRHHCHIKKGKPTYVAVWWEQREGRVIEVTYVGTHEKAPY